MPRRRPDPAGAAVEPPERLPGELEDGSVGAAPPGPPEPEQERADEPAPDLPPIRARRPHADRVSAIGMTGSGKSTILAALWADYAGQRILIDVNDAYELGPAATAEDGGGYCVANRISEIDWRARTIHVIPRSHGEVFYDDLYAAVWDRAAGGTDLCVWLDECYGPTSSNKAPRWLRTVVTQGRKKGILHLAATQEPMNVLPVLYSQAEHLFLFQLTGRVDELRALGPRFGMDVNELAAQLHELPEYGYLRSGTRARGHVWQMPPLPPTVLERTWQHVVFEA